MTDIEPTNGDLAELLSRAAENEEGHRVRALRRAARAAMFWPNEASDLAERGRSLTELRSVGPWVESLLLGWLESPPDYWFIFLCFKTNNWQAKTRFKKINFFHWSALA